MAGSTEVRNAVPSMLLVLLASTGACGEREQGTPAIAARDSAGITIVESDLARLATRCSVDAEPSVVIGTAGGDPRYELYRVFGASRLSDGRIVLVNQGSQELRFYDPEGRFLQSAGGAGGGPGEFRDAFYLWVLPGDTIWVGDYRPWQFLVFSPEGEWVRTVRPRPEYPNPPGVIDVLDDGRSVLSRRAFIAYGPRFETRNMTVAVHGADGMLIDTVGTYPNGRWGRVGDDPNSPGLYPLFESFARVAASGSRVVVGHTSRPELEILEASVAPSLERIIRWTAGSREIQPEDVEAERRRLAEPYEDMDPAMRRQLVDPLVSDERPVADEFPAFSSLMLGRDDRIWIRQYPRPGASETPEWVAFGSDGRFDCRLALPPFDELLEFGQDYLLALEKDELDVERVVQYGIGPAVDP
jgi:hypothetical protein